LWEEVNQKITYNLNDPKNGVYAFVLNGNFTIQDQALENRDGLGIWEQSQLSIKSLSANAELLLMEVPLAI
jgi:redox-sensitive bicupin YhaK (pirin superfamily)